MSDWELLEGVIHDKEEHILKMRDPLAYTRDFEENIIV
jgi:hypothetical protein